MTKSENHFALTKKGNVKYHKKFDFFQELIAILKKIFTQTKII